MNTSTCSAKSWSLVSMPCFEEVVERIVLPVVFHCIVLFTVPVRSIYNTTTRIPLWTSVQDIDNKRYNFDTFCFGSVFFEIGVVEPTTRYAFGLWCRENHH